jgi:RNA methyltransferase, TrmH family
MEHITSEQNPLLKDIRKAAARGSLTSEGYALAEGFHLLEEAIRSGLEIGTVVVAESAAEKLSDQNRLRVVSVPDAVYKGLSSTETPQGVMALVKLKAFALDQLITDAALILILDQVQDPGNAGAMVRAAEAFGATGVVFLKGSVHAHNSKCLRGSAGSIFRMPLVERVGPEELLAALSAIPIYAAMPREGAWLEQVNLARPSAIAIGSEAQGVSASLAAGATAIRIPTARVESLNAATAAAVILYEAQRQRKS